MNNPDFCENHYIRGSSSISLPDSKISGGSISLIRQKRCTNTKPKILNAPPLTKIGHHPPHGKESPSSDWTFQVKRPHQRIIYPLGSALARAIFDWCRPPVTVTSTNKKKQQKRHDDDEDQQILSKCVLGKDPDLPLRIGDTYFPPNTLHDGRWGGAATASCTAAATRVVAARPRGGDWRGGGCPSCIERKGREETAVAALMTCQRRQPWQQSTVEGGQ